MTGLKLAREYYLATRDFLHERMPEVMSQACAGLCGEGSECFGCDDGTSRDHDFSATYCLWLPETVMGHHARQIADVFRELPQEFRGVSARIAPHMANRRGPRSIEDYYFFFTGLARAPEGWREWLSLSETQLAAATNGEIFEDAAGSFSARRQALLAGYPEDVRLKKLAARCMQMAQSGQYNLARCLGRRENAAALLALARFTEAAIAFVFLANRRYMPFYKWAPRLGRALPLLGAELGVLLDTVGAVPLGSDRTRPLVDGVESFCATCAAWLEANGLSDEQDSWLWLHGPSIISRVRSPELRELDLLQDSL